jgi:hypothetical protein
VIHGRFQIALAIMLGIEIYGQVKPFRTYRRLFIVSGNYLLQPFIRSLALSFLSFSFWPFFWPSSSAARVSALLTHLSKTTTRDIGYGNAAADEHQTVSVH